MLRHLTNDVLRNAAERVRVRVRPWSAAGRTRPGTAEVAVVGGGAAGLATAALLQRRGAKVVVLDRHAEPGRSWAERYDSLRLNTVRWMSDLPGLPMPRSAGRWPSAAAVAAYHADYAAYHGLTVERFGAERIDVGTDGFAVVGRAGARRFDAVAIAVGRAAIPALPPWAEHPTVVHSSSYRRPSQFGAPRRAVVVGGGTSGAEIAVDLADTGWSVIWSIRSSARFVGREVAGIPTTPFGILGDLLPHRWVDSVAPLVERGAIGRRRALPPADVRLTGFLDGAGIQPVTALRVVELIRNGTVALAPGVADLHGESTVEVRLVDGGTVSAELVVAATGYRSGLAKLVGGIDGVLDADGCPVGRLPRPGIGIIGFRPAMGGMLWQIVADAHAVADELARLRPNAINPSRSPAR